MIILHTIHTIHIRILPGSGRSSGCTAGRTPRGARRLLWGDIHTYIYIYVYTYIHRCVYIYNHSILNMIHYINNNYNRLYHTCALSRKDDTHKSTSVNIFSLSLSIYTYIYIYIEREREILYINI